MHRQKLALAVGATALLAFAGGAAAQNAVDTFSNFAWRNLSPSACLARAAQSLDQTLAAFGAGNAVVSTSNLRVLGRTDDLNVFVYCFADDETPALDGAAAPRVLVAIYVSTSRGSVGGDMRDHLAVCMQTGVCPAAAAPATPPRTKP